MTELRYFKLSEFDQYDLPNSGVCMDVTFLQLIDELRHLYGHPIKITSGFRSPEYNAKVSSTGATGPHTTGKAADIQVSGARAHRLLKIALELGFTGIGISQKGDHDKRFIHLDILTQAEGFPRPHIWSY